MSNPTALPQIFISYAREDYASVRQLYDRLKGAGYKPWMDKVDLPKGADFAKAIPKVLRESDLFIVCLSTHSVNKRSFIQREINLALDILEEKLGDDLYIFPVRLEACVAPDRISKFNWTDLFGDEHEEEWQALLAALSAQAERLGKATATPPQAVIAAPLAPTPAQPEPVLLPKPYIENLNGVPLEMILVPAGKFTMGSDKRDDEKPPHEVIVPSFYIGKFQITQKQWQAVMGKNPSHFKGDELPVEGVSWHDAQAFCEKLRVMTGKAYRLPSEAEWEYACRAGTTGNYAGKLDEMAWYRGNSENQTHPVGQKKPNAFGLYDMHGNVWEWCEDVWRENYNGAPTDGSAWTDGGNQDRRVLRGGSWGLNDNYCRSAYRSVNAPGVINVRFGYRVVVSAGTP
jgi:formylglycine-generating enzyme required for sulfatase activity